MSIPVFLSYPKPHLVEQRTFIDRIVAYLKGRGLEPRTLGVTDYDMAAPLKAIRRLMLESNGLVTIAFRRTLVVDARVRPGADVAGATETALRDVWLTSPYCQIEPAMAYQLGLPTLIVRERGVHREGLLESGVVGTYMPEFVLGREVADYLESPEWRDLIGRWEGFVRVVADRKGNPPVLY